MKKPNLEAGRYLTKKCLIALASLGFEVGPIYFDFCNPITTPMGENLGFEFVGLAYPLKDVGFRFIIEYSSLKDFWPLWNRSIFLYEDFLNMIFWLVLKLEISYIVISCRILVSEVGFFED
jgi:hypothetical protein